MNRPRDNWPNTPHSAPVATLDTSKIKFAPIDADLFNTVAKKTADELSRAGRDKNKSTQIRRFYDELLMWDTKAMQNPEKFDEFLPFIRMLNAKAAYAEGRNNVDSNFTTFINHSLQQVTDEKTLHTFKLFFEAMLGFYKLVKDGKN